MKMEPFQRLSSHLSQTSYFFHKYIIRKHIILLQWNQLIKFLLKSSNDLKFKGFKNINSASGIQCCAWKYSTWKFRNYSISFVITFVIYFKIHSAEFQFLYLADLHQSMLFKLASTIQILTVIRNLKHCFSDNLFEQTGGFWLAIVSQASFLWLCVCFNKVSNNDNRNSSWSIYMEWS